MRDFSRLPPQVFTHCTVKHANVLAMPAMKSLGMGLGKVLGAAKGGAGRYMELLRGTKLQNLVRKHEMASELGNIADPPGVIKDIMRRISGGGLQGQIGDNAADVARQLQHQTLGETAKVYGTRVGTVGAGLLGGSAALQGALAKESASLPEPTCRGMTKKVTMPGENKQQPDLDPEGVQMSAQDYSVNKSANLKFALRALAAGAVQKQAFMGLGALAGMATAPNKEEEDLSTGRGALRGVGTGLGAAAGAGIGALGGTVGGAGLGAVLGALARAIPSGSPNRLSFSDAIGRGATTGGGLGYLAGIPAGAIYGGYKGNKATKALLDKTAPISDKKKDKKDDDKDVKEAAASVLAQIKRNHAAAV